MDSVSLAAVDVFYLQSCLKEAKSSKDPNTRVGSFLVQQGRCVSFGWNSFPEGVAYTAERLANRDLKNRLMVHAEMNAILDAARYADATDGCTLYLAATDDSGLIWGGPPCTRCTVEIIQAGIIEVVSLPKKNVPSKWHEDIAFAGELLKEAGVLYREVSLEQAVRDAQA